VDADVVVLDLWLASDTMLRGTPAMQLLSYYLDLGKPVVALQRLGGPPGPSPVTVSSWCRGLRPGGLLILAWRSAGGYGLDRFVLPRLGTPWHRGELFGRRADKGDRTVTT
jgi:hypothetical protein